MDDPFRKATVRAEATLLRIPLFGLAVKGSGQLDGIEFRFHRRRGDESLEAVIRTERDDRTPYPGPLSRRVHMAILSLVADQGFPVSNPITWTWRDLCRRMGLPNSGRRIGELKAALRSTWGLKIFGLEAINPTRNRETWRRLYAECEFLHDPRSDGTPADANRLWLAPWYLKSLNELHAVPVDYDLWKALEAVGPVASRLYEYLLPSFYKRETLELAYDRLAPAMPVVIESRRSHAIRQFSSALQALEKAEILSGHAWDAMKGTGRPKLILHRGPRLASRGKPDRSKPGRSGPTGKNEIDPGLIETFVQDFYKLLGKDVQPFPSDLSVARGLMTRLGVESAFALLPDAVRRLKSGFRNAESMGPLARYMDQAEASIRRQEEAEDRRRMEARRRQESEAQAEARDQELRQSWAALSESRRDAIRQDVLRDQPLCRRFPALLEAACLMKLADSSPSEA
ncbi:MAG TPA: hypothetical protein VFT74_15930 [Isosphaeraceae bacterium]|nr:hypothetical protein [Isosphaeraceae bacterium]